MSLVSEFHFPVTPPRPCGVRLPLRPQPPLLPSQCPTPITLPENSGQATYSRKGVGDKKGRQRDEPELSTDVASVSLVSRASCGPLPTRRLDSWLPRGLPPTDWSSSLDVVTGGGPLPELLAPSFLFSGPSGLQSSLRGQSLGSATWPCILGGVSKENQEYLMS